MSGFSTSGQRHVGRQQDWFVHGISDGIHRVIVGSHAERILDTLHVGCLYLDPELDVSVADRRTGLCWEGHLIALPDVREVLGSLRSQLTSYGGVELSLYTGDDQLTLTPELLLIIQARSARWTFFLDELGFVERESLPRPNWHQAGPGTLRAAAPLLEALKAAVERLDLREVKE